MRTDWMGDLLSTGVGRDFSPGILARSGIAIAALLALSNPALAASGALVDAVRSRSLPAVRAAVAGADVNASVADGATALHWAAHLDDTAIAEVLLSRGARANVANEYGVTPLALACTNGSAAMVDV